MKKRVLIILMGMFLLASPMSSRVHIRHTGPKKELTEQEKKEIDKKNNVFLVLGIIFFWQHFLFWHNQKEMILVIKQIKS